MLDLVKFIVSELVLNKDAVDVTLVGDTTIKVKVQKEDVGRIIGRQGRAVNSIRSVVKSASAKSGVKYTIDIVE